MPRRAAKVDANQKQIVKALRRVGASVAITSALGDGFPDLVVGYRGKNYLLEVKDGTQPPSRRKLTPDEEQWHRTWTGDVRIVESVDDALAVLEVGFRHKYRTNG